MIEFQQESRMIIHSSSLLVLLYFSVILIQWQQLTLEDTLELQTGLFAE